MERLTHRGTKEAKSNVTIREVTDRLAEYENKIEDGLMVMFPIPLKGRIYDIGTQCNKSECEEYDDYCWRGCKKVNTWIVHEMAVSGYEYREDGIVITGVDASCDSYVRDYHIEDIGRCVFLTPEEADSKLQEIMRDKQQKCNDGKGEK